MLINERREAKRPRKRVIINGVLAGVALFSTHEIIKNIDDNPEIKISNGIGNVVCDDEPVVVQFTPTDLDSKFYSGSVRIRAYNPENSANPSGFYIDINVLRNPKEYSVGVASINEEGVSDLNPDFLDHSTFKGNAATDLSFTANQAYWSIDVNPKDSTVIVAGSCSDSNNENESIVV